MCHDSHCKTEPSIHRDWWSLFKAPRTRVILFFAAVKNAGTATEMCRTRNCRVSKSLASACMNRASARCVHCDSVALSHASWKAAI